MPRQKVQAGRVFAAGVGVVPRSDPAPPGATALVRLTPVDGLTRPLWTA